MYKMDTIFSAILIVLLLCGTQGKTTMKPTSIGLPPVHDKLLNSIPLDKIREIEQAHLNDDDGFKAAVLYLQGKEWKALVSSVLNSTEFGKFSEMALKYKLNISEAINCLETYINSLKVVSTKITSKPNLDPFILDIQKALPIGEIVKALSYKDNPEAKRVIEGIGTKENQKIAEDLHNLPAMVKMRQILKDMNFDVEPYISLVYAFLGWVH